MAEDASAQDLIDAMENFLKVYGNSEVLKRLDAIEADIKDIKKEWVADKPTPSKPKPPNVNLLNGISPELRAYIDEVSDLDREVRIYLKWMSPELFTEISEILKSRGYTWVSKGKDSHWMRKK